MDSKEYWRKREAENLDVYLKEEEEYTRQLNEIYNRTLDNVQREINAFYGKYAAAEGISIAEAKKRVSEMDIAEYERKAQKYVEERDFSDQANEEMRLYNLTMKVNRLEMLKANIGLELVAGHDELEKYMGDILKGRTMEELKRQAGILGKSIRNNAELANAIVNSSFRNAKFSDRIWMNQELLKAELAKSLQTGLIQGRNARALAKDIQKQFGVSKYNAERLMRTELARVQTEAQKQSFENNGFEEYEFITNSGCCDACQALDGKHFKVKSMMPGDNAPPIHPNCRCSVAAYEDDDEYEAWLDYLDKGGSTAEWEDHGKAEWQRGQNISVTFNNQITKVKSSDTVEKQTKYSKIKLADINKMLTDYERKVLDAVPKKEGYFDFAAHGSAESIEYGSRDKTLSAREVARIIKHSESYHGEKVRLLSCNTGSTDSGFAQQLANALGVEVEAPSDVLIVYPDGSYKIGYDGKGEMITFKPQGRK